MSQTHHYKKMLQYSDVNHRSPASWQEIIVSQVGDSNWDSYIKIQLSRLKKKMSLPQISSAISHFYVGMGAMAPTRSDGSTVCVDSGAGINLIRNGRNTIFNAILALTQPNPLLPVEVQDVGWNVPLQANIGVLCIPVTITLVFRSQEEAMGFIRAVLGILDELERTDSGTESGPGRSGGSSGGGDQIADAVAGRAIVAQ